MKLLPGQDLLVSLEKTEGLFLPIAGLRSRSITFRSSTADASHAESGVWRQLLPGGGLRQLTVSGVGLFLNDEAANASRAAFFADTYANWRIEIPPTGVISGPFHLVSLDITGVTDAEASMSLSLVSAGALTFEEAAA